ncbi:LOW QUALITY PROTEIN: DNA excision repair protein ERCC-5 [Megalobrama amblycephala]|uniref:LOW QUALITY PROTEIN: DNA excision repair protein ERCC-5 n=1 Tax=Megalobrama amblycephala TaxID=75352 RepID=UPI0020144E71|nr:LOW QUALITY PROTEIN: DNA excision repair protein ERCC-5 [Megalobrama amblycephala]
MGVHGLWRLLESTGKPVNPETLEGKILAVDISIWLNQAVKGVRDRDGNAVQNAHLLTLFHRLCKLLFFRIRPVFVYDGDAPLLKKQTLAIRRQRREELSRESRQTNEKLLRTFLKRQAIKAALGDQSQEPIPSLSSVRRDDQDDMYVLPALPADEDQDKSSSEEERDGDESTFNRFQEEIYDNPNSVDINSEEFSLMPPEIKHEILKELKEFNKRRRTLFHKPPERSGEFSQYQLAGLLQRNKLNQRLEGVEQEMNQRSSGGAESKDHDMEVRRLVSEDSSHYILIKGSQKKPSAPESQSAPALWSSCPWESKGKPKGKPEPLWRPMTEEEENKPSYSSSCAEEDLPASGGAPASPRTLQAIQSAMMDSSSEEEAIDTRGHKTTGSDGKDGSASPRTLQAIQSAMMDSGSEEEIQRKTRGRRTTGSDDEDRSVSPQTLQAIQSAMMDSGSEEEAGKTRGCSATGSDDADGSVSPRTLQAIQSPVTEPTVHKRRAYVITSSSEDEDEAGAIVSSQEESSESKPQAKSPLIPGSAVETREPRDATVNLHLKQRHPNTSSDHLPVNTDRTEENKLKSEDDEESGSEESFIEVSDVEEPPETQQSHVKAEEAADKSPSEESEEEEEESREEESGIQSSDKSDEVSEAVDEAPAAASEWDHIDTEELLQLDRHLQDEQTSLREQQQQQERSSTSVTGQMCQESQELLRLFGVPFIVAPMEAEAQCAALDRLDQTHGTITDDSDIWLFGGRHVYKNFFNQNKYVEHYQSADMQNQLGLDRSKLINLAYLLGSDYTEGIPGVGFVTGMEILNEFPGAGLEPLLQLSAWWAEAQENKKLSANPKDTKVKKKLRNLQLHPGFPNPAVAHAYLQPSVDQSDASFSWGRPHLELIKEFCLNRFGWNSRKTEETLQPVLRQLQTQQTQLRIDSFFRLEQQERQTIRSQRLRRAVTCLKRKEREEEEDEEETSPSKQGRTEASPSAAVGPSAGGFIGSAVHADIQDETRGGEVGGATQHRTLMSSRAESSSSSSEDDAECGRGVAMVTARSVFDGKTRGRGKRGGRGRSKNRS